MSDGAIIRKYRRVADEIGREIAAGRLRPGDRLPAERELSTTFAVSRPTIREAIIALELAGQVEVRGGSGVYVLDPPVRQSPSGSDPGVFEILEARKLVEPGVAEMAARTIDAAAMSALRHCVIEMIEAFEARVQPDAVDGRFHLIIAEATGNAAIVSVLRQLWDMRAESRTLRQLEEFAGKDRVRLAAIEDHVRILTALASGDPDAAREAMAVHMENNITVLMETASDETDTGYADALSLMRLRVSG